VADTRKRKRWLAAVGLALALGAVWLSWEAAGGTPAREESPAPATLPADLERVPRDAVGFLSIRVADLWNSPLLKEGRPVLLKQAPEMRQTMIRSLGAAPEQIERLTFIVMEMGPGSDPVALVATRKPYDRKTVLGILEDGSKTEMYLRHTLHVSQNGRRAVHLYDESTYVFGNTKEVKEFLGFPRDRTAGPLTDALRQATGKHAQVLGVNGVAISRFINRELARQLEELPPPAKPFLPLLKARSATAVLDLGEKAIVDVRVQFGNDKEAAAGIKAVQAARQLASVGLTGQIARAEREPGMKSVVALFKLLERALKSAKIEQKGTAVTAFLQSPFEQKTISLLLLEAVQKVRAAAARAQSQNNLKQIGLAMHNYANSNGYHFPPHAVYDKNGKPLLSWRVLILPYIEQDGLYKQFHLDEPWDSEHNKKLLARMPPVYAGGDPKALKAHETHYQGFHGKGAVFEGKKGIVFPASIIDGTSNTILVVEAAKAVPWTKPDDIPFDANKKPSKELLKQVGGLFPGGFNAGFCDGSVRFLSQGISPKTLWSLITRNAGDIPGPDF
jgi:prepilin-type processing-associated H-X9-DG protein